MNEGSPSNVVLVEAKKTSITNSIFGIWTYKSLLFYFAARMTRQRYKGTILGWLWLFIRPLVNAFLYTMVFGNMVKVPSDGVPYLVFFFSGFIIWSFFSSSLLYMTRSLSSNRRIITKLYFPRIIVPLASVTPFLLELLIFGVVFLGIILYYWLGTGMLYLDIRPAFMWCFYFLLLAFMMMLGIGLWTSILNVDARDVKFTLPYLLQIGFFITPVIFPLSLAPEEWKWLILLNPMAVVVEGFRWSLLGVGGVSGSDIVVASVMSAVIFFIGVWFCSKTEASLADRF